MLNFVPIHLLALKESRVVGVATLKDQSALHKLFPDLQYWLSSVYVSPEWRGRGVATALCLKIADIASARGLIKLYLQTEALNGRLYAKIGWKPIKQVHLDGVELLIMSRNLAKSAKSEIL